MNKQLSLLLLILSLSLTGPYTYGQSSTESLPAATIGATPDNKMLGGTSIGSSLESITNTNLFSGGMNISVPIYNYGNTDFGVSLSYNTQGIKVDELDGLAGLHWNLDCGGSIVRNIRDLPDELLQTTDSLLGGNLPGDVYHNYGPRIFIPNKEMHNYGKLFAYGEAPAKLNAGNAYVDHECDEFFVSIPGMSFNFYIGKNLKIFTTTTKHLKVQVLADNNPISNISEFNPETQTLNFKITDNQGNQFYFQPYRSDITEGINQYYDWANLRTDTTFAVLKGSFPVKWELRKIILADGKSINYKYEAHIVQLPPGTLPPSSSDKAYTNYFVMEIGVSGTPNIHNYGGTQIDQKTGIYFSIDEIDYPNNIKVIFKYDSLRGSGMGNSSVQEIKVSSGDNCARFRLYQSRDLTNQRYYLDSITRLSADNSVEERYYSFTYNPILEVKEIALPGYPTVYDTIRAKLPRRLNTGQDLFGYYNNDSVGVGASAGPINIGGDVTIPRHHPDIGGSANYGSERAYNAQYAQAGLLTSVKNAYGGIEYFYYGPNEISSIPLVGTIPTDNSFIGTHQPDGVRIDSIIKIDPALPFNRLLTVFEYSGGQIFMPGGYFHFPDIIDSTTNAWTRVIYQGIFQTAHQLINGSNHGYSTVEVKNYANETLLSRRVTTFTNMQDATSNNQPRYYKVPGSKDYFEFPYTKKQYLKDWEIGLPLTITDYDQNNRIVKKGINHYDFSAIDLSAASYISNTKLIKVNSGTPTSVPYSSFLGWYYPYKKIITDDYYPYKGVATLSKTVTQKYISDSRYVADTIWYVYDSHHNLSSTVTQDSKGGKTATELVYNYDVDGPQYASGHPGYTAHPGTMLYDLSADGLEKVISIERWRLLPGTTITDPYGGTVLQNNNKLLSSFITGYQYQNEKLWTKSLWNTQIGNPLEYTTYTGLGSGVVGNPYGKILTAYNTANPVANFIKTSQVTLFDAKGNPMETQMQAQNQYKAMIWDTATGQKLAEAANCRYSDIAYTSFEDNLSESNFTVSYTAALTTASDAVTGTHILYLWKAPTYQGDPGDPVTITGKQNLKAGKTYLISFWVSVSGSNPAPTLKAGTQNISLANQVVYTKGSWKKYLVRFTPSAAGKITITGTSASSRIDEIRLFPANAQMQSWTYEPLFGKNSQTDPSGKIIYYRYDKLGRQNLILDMDGNILSKTDYHIAQ